MSLGEAYRPSDQTLLIYDKSDDQIATMITAVKSLLEMYTLHFNVIKIQNWSRQDEYASNVAFFVSVDTELLYKRVKKRLIECQGKDLLLILTYDKCTSKIADDIVKDVQKKRAKMQKSAVKTKNHVTKANVKDKLVISKIELPSTSDNEIEVSKWLPYLLHLISGKRTHETNRELGVFYRIDPDIDVQCNWYERQRQVLESYFNIKCSYSGSDECSDDEYVRNADCVVLYVSGQTLKRLNTLEDQQKSIIDLAKMQSTCKLYVYFEKIHRSFEKTMEECYRMHRVGVGALTHWIELLSTLGLVTMSRRTDWTVYRNCRRDDNYRDRYKPNLDRAITHRAISMNSVDSGSDNEANDGHIHLEDSLNQRPVVRLHTQCNVKEAIYKPYDDGPPIVKKDEERSETRVSCMTCICNVF